MATEILEAYENHSKTEFGDVSRRVAIEFMQLHNLSDEIDLLMEYENIYSRVFKN